jgi:hypothetical protein
MHPFKHFSLFYIPLHQVFVFGPLITAAKMACLKHGTNILPSEGNSTFISSFYMNSDTTPFAL